MQKISNTEKKIKAFPKSNYLITRVQNTKDKNFFNEIDFDFEK